MLQSKSKTQNQTPKILIEAELTDNSTKAPTLPLREKTKSATRSFIDEIANETKNYNRVSQTNLNTLINDFGETNNKDSGIDSHRDGGHESEKPPYRFKQLRKESLSDLDNHLKQNRKIIKRLNNKKQKIYHQDTFDSLQSYTTDDMTPGSSVNTKKLKSKLYSGDANNRTRNAIIDLLALDKAVKQKKLNVLKQQRVIEIQKMKLNDTVLVSRSLTNFSDAKAQHGQNYKKYLNDKINDIALEKVIFPAIVKKYNPYGYFEDEVYPADYYRGVTRSASQNYNQVYLDYPSRSFASNHSNDVSYEEVMSIIDEIEQREQLSGKHTGSNYYLNGRLIKGSDRHQNNSDLDYDARAVQVYKVDPRPKSLPPPRQPIINSSRSLYYPRQRKNESTSGYNLNKILKILDYSSDDSNGSTESLPDRLTEIKKSKKQENKKVEKPQKINETGRSNASKEKAKVIELNGDQKPKFHKVNWDRKGILTNEVLKPRRTKSEFYPPPRLPDKIEPKKSFFEILNEVLQAKKAPNQLKSKSETNLKETQTKPNQTLVIKNIVPRDETKKDATPKLPTANNGLKRVDSTKSNLSRSSTISNISKMFREAIQVGGNKNQEKSPVKTNEKNNIEKPIQKTDVTKIVEKKPSETKPKIEPMIPPARVSDKTANEAPKNIPRNEKKFILQSLLNKVPSKKQPATASNATAAKPQVDKAKEKENKKRQAAARKAEIETKNRTKKEEEKARNKKKKEEQLKKKQEKNKNQSNTAKSKEASKQPGFFGRILNKLPFSKKKNQNEPVVQENYKSRRVFDYDLPGSNDYLRNPANKNLPKAEPIYAPNKLNPIIAPPPVAPQLPTPANQNNKSINEIARQNPLISRSDSISEIVRQNPLLKPEISPPNNNLNNNNRTEPPKNNYNAPNNHIASNRNSNEFDNVNNQQEYRYQGFSVSNLLLPKPPATNNSNPLTNPNNDTNNRGSFAGNLIARQNPLLNYNQENKQPNFENRQEDTGVDLFRKVLEARNDNKVEKELNQMIY